MDGEKVKQDASLKEDSSVNKPNQTSVEAPETLTRAEAVKMVSDALSKAGREAKTLSEGQQRLNAGLAELTAKQAAWQNERDEAIRNAIKEWDLRDQPEELTTFRATRRKKTDDEAKATEVAEREAKLAEREAKTDQRDIEFADIMEQHKMLKRTQLATEVAVEKGVSRDAILKLAKADTREAYEEVAEHLPPVKEQKVILSDSGRTNRGGTLTEESVKGLSKDQIMANYKEIAKLPLRI